MKGEQIPDGVYYADGNFYDLDSRHGMGHLFHNHWFTRASEFPGRPENSPIIESTIPPFNYIVQPRAEHPTNDELVHSITLLYDMAAKQANQQIRQAYIQVGAWLRDKVEKS